ncbi:hypothetical protein DCE93_07695 [Agromyces badenianii]|uniref:Uncharacterized protein n=1 Tax=Agromyces badenianii TaxID=2080742 RepID=A0A2S0WW39_9MICO|nr:hypothetical protein [Agromyces badenianii]AWB95557.1 hypothetical protein DCE93_07695 [Agromyces badenianii]PWC04143.1 hypothetical protein DCE94_08240 [Agromyces badenianii]
MSDAYARPTGDDAATTTALPNFAPAPPGQVPREAATPSTDPVERRKWSSDLRFMLVVLAAIVALFLAFALLIAFSPTGPAISALAIIAAPIATMVAAYYGISLALRQVRDARNAAEASEARARAAEVSARESDAWAAQMESGLRVAVAKLKAVSQDTRDVERAAGTPDEFF